MIASKQISSVIWWIILKKIQYVCILYFTFHSCPTLKSHEPVNHMHLSILLICVRVKFSPIVPASFLQTAFRRHFVWDMEWFVSLKYDLCCTFAIVMLYTISLVTDHLVNRYFLNKYAFEVVLVVLKYFIPIQEVCERQNSNNLFPKSLWLSLCMIGIASELM